jgi:hypothetical protein
MKRVRRDNTNQNIRGDMMFNNNRNRNFNYNQNNDYQRNYSNMDPNFERNNFR